MRTRRPDASITRIQKKWGISAAGRGAHGGVYAVRRWLKGVGVISTALGTAGLMQLMFWPSVYAIYLGLLLLIWDLWYEEFNGYLRALIATALFSLAIAFTVIVVMRKAPVFADYQIGNGVYVVFVLRDESMNDDYRNVDLTIWPDGDNGLLYVDELKQTNGFPAQIVNSSPDHINPKRPNCPPEGALVYYTGKGYVILQNTVRIRAEVLPKGGYIEITAALTKKGSELPSSPW